MKQAIAITGFILCSIAVYGQQSPEKYEAMIQVADSFYQRSMWAAAAKQYLQSFEANGGSGKVRDRYKAAVCLTLSGDNEQALDQLERIAFKGGFSNYEMLEKDPVFFPLKNISRWRKIVDKVKENSRMKS